MSLAIVYTRANSGIQAPLVTVETHLSCGLPQLNIVGLPATAVKESKDRVRSALINSHFEYPTRRMTVNLAPADLPKDGGRFDLPIALGLLAASEQIPREALAEYEFSGELALTGELRAVSGVLPVVLGAKQARRKLILPYLNALEASIVKDAQVYFADNLLQVCDFLRGEACLNQKGIPPLPVMHDDKMLNMADVKGQLQAKHALEIAAAGRHSLLLIGPPGTGKTMLANRLPSILPPLTEEQALESAAIASISSVGFNPAQWQKIPLRAPHHSASGVALVGGGRPPKPGEISLAHHGVLFLDELPEFSRHVLESLREPLESGHITISRAACQAVFPANFQMIAAMNPCPCGYAGSQRDQCRCTGEQVQRYLAKLSGPLLDRIDMHVEVPGLPPDIMLRQAATVREDSAVIAQRVQQARDRQFNRQGKYNVDLTAKELDIYCRLDAESILLMDKIMNKFNFSARVCHRILKISRTIADLEGMKDVKINHLEQCVTFRCLDKVKFNK